MASDTRPLRSNLWDRRKDKGKWFVRFETAPGKWSARAGYSDRRRSETLRKQLEKEANDRHLGLVDESRQEMVRPIAEVIAEFDAYMEAKGTTAKHRAKTLARLNKIVDFAGFESLRDIEPGALDRFRNKQRKDGDATKTRNDYLGSIKSLCRWAHRRGKLKADPLVAVDPERIVDRTERGAFSVAELYKICRAAPERSVEKAKSPDPAVIAQYRRKGEHRAMAYQLMFWSGLRLNELRTLTWKQVDPEFGWLHVEARYAKAKTQQKAPLPAGLFDLLEEFRAEEAKHLGRIPGPGDLVVDVPGKLVLRLRKDMEFSGVPLEDAEGRARDVHSFRASFLTECGKDVNLSETDVQDYARHSDPRVTQRYIKRTDHRRRSSLDERFARYQPGYQARGPQQAPTDTSRHDSDEATGS